MCGIAGIISQRPKEDLVHLLKKMSNAIAHRGPDGEGHWANSEETVGLAHRRLAIIDTSEQGAQPMHYQDRYSITYNGEIYNYLELKVDLEKKGHSFRTNTDTEVLLALYAEYGEECLPKIDGMFAFVIYDQKLQKLFCARDRFGEKPFYYYYTEQEFVFGSEMKVLWAVGVPKSENPTMQYNYLAYGFMHNPNDFSETFYKDIHSLPQSYCMTLDIRTNKMDIQNYYQLGSPEFEGSELDAMAGVEELLRKSVSWRLRSDVSFGSSLSGGLDSSLIAVLVKKEIGEKELKTFSAVFPGFVKDESAYIKSTIQKVKANSFTCTPSLEEYKAEKERFLNHQEEPVIDESPYFLYKVYELAKKNNIKVLLDGQGADEVFAGYHAYYFTFLKEIKLKSRELYKSELKSFQELVKSGVVNDYAFFRRQNAMASLFGEKLSNIRVWKQKIDQFRKSKIDHELFKSEHKNSFHREYNFDLLAEHLNYDCHLGKLQTLLRYADRSSMAHGVEIRLPFLNHELVDFVGSLPAEMKIKKGWTKWILRETFKDYLSPEVAWRIDKVGAEGELK